MDKVNLAEKFGKISEYWKPYIVAELNGQHVKLDKILGEFVFHHHEKEDEMFLVVKGRFRMEFRDRHEWIEEGEFLVVPRGVEHRPVADRECWIMLFEPASTLNTGNVVNHRTLRNWSGCRDPQQVYVSVLRHYPHHTNLCPATRKKGEPQGSPRLRFEITFTRLRLESQI